MLPIDYQIGKHYGDLETLVSEEAAA